MRLMAIAGLVVIFAATVWAMCVEYSPTREEANQKCEAEEPQEQPELKDSYDAQQEQWKVCADEGQACSCTGQVLFGRKFLTGKPGSGATASVSQMKTTGYNTKEVSGSTTCSASAMGGDPLSGYNKYCQCKAAEQANLALNRPTSQVSSIFNHGHQDHAKWNSANAVDGRLQSENSDEDRVCSHTKHKGTLDDYPWWRVDLQANHSVAVVRITMRKRTGSTFLNVSVEGSGEKAQCGDSVSPVMGQTLDIQCSPPITGSAVKVVQQSKGLALALCEVEVFSGFDDNTPCYNGKRYDSEACLTCAGAEKSFLGPNYLTKWGVIGEVSSRPSASTLTLGTSQVLVQVACHVQKNVYCARRQSVNESQTCNVTKLARVKQVEMIGFSEHDLITDKSKNMHSEGKCKDGEHEHQSWVTPCKQKPTSMCCAWQLSCCNPSLNDTQELVNLQGQPQSLCDGVVKLL